jgi:Zn-dependent protease with chaperone function
MPVAGYRSGMEARSGRATSEAEVPSAERSPVDASAPQSEPARRVGTTDVGGALLYLATLGGELGSALVRGMLVYGVATVVPFVTGHASVSEARLLGWIAGVFPLVWSLCALAFRSSGWWWSTGAGARRPSARERALIAETLAALIAGRPDVREPRAIYVLDDPELNAAVRGDALMANRGLLDSRWLAPVLAHELGHLNSSDGRLTDALARLVLRRSRTRPRQPASGCLGLLAQLVFLVAGGGSGLLLTRPLWAAYWRSREYLADAFAARLGQGSDLLAFLETEVVLYDRPVPFAWMSEVGHPPTELRIEALTALPQAESSDETDRETPASQPAVSRPVAAARGLLAIAAIALAVTLAGNGPGPPPKSSAQSAIENPLQAPGSEGGAWSPGSDLPSQAQVDVEFALGASDTDYFSEVASLADESCSPTSSPRVFACTLTYDSGRQMSESFELYRGELARISHGGDSGRAPRSDVQATALVTRDLRADTPSAAARCRLRFALGDRALHSISLREDPGTYTCVMLMNGRPAHRDANGDPSRTIWRWNADGSVAKDTTDTDPVSDEFTR